MSEFDPNTSKLLYDSFQKGGWLPISDGHLKEWINATLTFRRAESKPALPVIQEFEAFIKNNSEMYMGFHRMFEGVTCCPTTYEELLDLFDYIIQNAPSYGAIGPPIYMAISKAMNTNGGFTTFLSTELNKRFKSMFAEWSKFLQSPESRHTLNEKDGGWFSPPALLEMQQHFDNKTFDRIFECIPEEPHKGFRSWDHFFNRTFRPGIRPVQAPDKLDIVNAACESTLYNLQKAKEYDTFWLKGEPYSLMHMLNNDPDYATQFIGGTVFQGFLAVTGYHRWHSPVAGTIKKITQIEGTYFVQSPATLNSPMRDGELPPYLRSLSFITAMTTRALIFIKSSNPLIGLMCFIAIGMTEVSTCEVTVQVGQEVAKGEQLGMFHFGGSSHVLIFRPETNIVFADEYSKPGQHVDVRAAIAQVMPLKGSITYNKKDFTTSFRIGDYSYNYTGTFDVAPPFPLPNMPGSCQLSYEAKDQLKGTRKLKGNVHSMGIIITIENGVTITPEVLGPPPFVPSILAGTGTWTRTKLKEGGLKEGEQA